MSTKTCLNCKNCLSYYWSRENELIECTIKGKFRVKEFPYYFYNCDIHEPREVKS